jgi:Mrp family chromosome partitioning ATPase
VARAARRRYHGDVAGVGKPPEEVLPPRFEVISSLGAGGMGEVFSVLDRESGARAALKLLARRGGAWASRFRHEFRCVADLRHPNLVRLGELFEHGDRWCFTMELLAGVDFLGWVLLSPGGEIDVDEPTLRGDPLRPPAQRYDERRLRDALAQLGDGLAAIHAAGIVHRDVKPSNVMVTPDGRVVLLDFGIAIGARVIDESELAVGTVDYMAPEQARAEQPEPPADLYSLGCMLYEVLVGRPPFEGRIMDVLTRKQRQDPASPLSLFAETALDLDELCMQLLDRQPARRPTARAVAERLRRTPPRSAPIPRSDDDEVGLLGRDDELAALLETVDEGSAAVHVVLGVAGIGKSALLAAVAAAAHQRGARVTVGRCHEREHLRGNAWDALFEAVTRDLAGLPRARRTRLLPADVGALACAFPSFERLIGLDTRTSVPAAQLEARARAALRELLERLTAEQPIVMIVDDAQWATADSHDLLAAVMAPPAPRLQVVLAARPQAGTGAALRDRVAALGRLGVAVRTTVLAPLSTSNIRTLAARRLPADRVDDAARAAQGNPLLLELATATDGADAGDASDVGAVLARRVADLPATEREVLAVAAMAPGPVRHDVVDRVLDAAPGASLGAIAELRHLHLVRTTGTGRADRVEPLHDAVRRAAEAAVSPRIRARLQRRLAEALDDDPSTDLATRCAAWVGTGDAPRAAAAARAMVTAARHSFELAHAALVCESVLALPLADDDRAAVQSALGEAWAGAGDTARAADALHAAASAADPALRLALLRRAAEHDLRAGRVDRGRAAAEAVARSLGLPIDGSTGRVAAQITVERTRLRRHGLDLHRGAVDTAMAAEADAQRSLAAALAAIDVVRAGHLQARALRLALASGDPVTAARALALEAELLVLSGGAAHEPRARRVLERAHALAAEAGRDDVDASILAATALCDLGAGDPTSALAGSDAAAAIFRDRCRGASGDDQRLQIIALWALAWLGRWGELRRRRELLAREAEATGDRLTLAHTVIGFVAAADIDGVAPAIRARIAQRTAPWSATEPVPWFHRLVAEATLDLADGDGAGALRRLDDGSPALTDSLLDRGDWFRAVLTELRARAALAAGDLDEAARSARRAARAPWASPPAALVQAAIIAARGRRDEAAAHFDEAATACDHAGLAMHAAAALDRRGALLGGSAGDELRGRATRRAIELGCAVPDRAFAVLAPSPSRAR